MIPIFTDGALASSVITTVWVGVFFVCLFNLRFGWVLSGLVVPGYLVPLIIVKPLAASIIVIEAVLTYLIVWLFSEKLAPGRWPALFGRDRFMGLILASIAVRVALDGLLLPELSEWLLTNWNRELDWRTDMQSFGLVIVSLLANQLWKPGLVRGLFAAFVVTGLTLIVVRYGLMEFTNFRISGVIYLYEGLASSIDAAPKAYMILAVTALYASHMNVKYGWDFSGILIPALIALQWYQPTKILTSFVEAAVIYVIARALLKLPVFANVTMEGARKLLFFFNISFAYKMLVGWTVVWLELDFKTIDLYGLGYLLATLLAIKAHDKGIAARLTRSTVQVSFVGAAMGNLAGFLLALVFPASLSQADEGDGRELARQGEDIAVTNAAGAAWLARDLGGGRALASQGANALEDLVELLEADVSASDVGRQVAGFGWQVATLASGKVAIARADGEGGAFLLFDPDARRSLAVTAPDPAAAAGLAFAAQEIARQQSARWLVVAPPTHPEDLAANGVLARFRGATKSAEMAVVSGEGEARLTLSGEIAPMLDLQRLDAALPGLDTDFAPGTATAVRSRATLALGTSARAGILDRTVPPPSAGNDACRLQVESGRPNRGLPLATLAAIRFEVVAPLIAGIDTDPSLTLARVAAARAGLGLDRCQVDGRAHWRLADRSDLRGAYLFAVGGRPDRVLLGYQRVDDPRFPPGGMIDPDSIVATRAFMQAWTPRFVALAPQLGAYRYDQASMYGTVSQAMVREAGSETPTVLQITYRAFDFQRRPLPDRLVVAADHLPLDTESAATLRQLVIDAGYDPAFADRTSQTAGLEPVRQGTLSYLEAMTRARWAVLWLPVGDPLR